LNIRDLEKTIIILLEKWNRLKKKILMEQLALALIYLSAWKEKGFDTEIYRSWKGYDFAVLDQLKDNGLIDFSFKAKSVILTEDGVRKAEALVANFLK